MEVNGLSGFIQIVPSRAGLEPRALVVSPEYLLPPQSPTSPLLTVQRLDSQTVPVMRLPLVGFGVVGEISQCFIVNESQGARSTQTIMFNMFQLS